MRQLTINEKAQVVYIPDDLAEKGWKGIVDTYVSPHSVTLARPGATTEEIISGLKFSIRELELLRPNGTK